MVIRLLVLVRSIPRVPIQFYLGIFGMTGLTAYVGLLRIGQLKEDVNINFFSLK
jgi:NADPH-dependent curcumin reductase CurA